MFRKWLLTSLFILMFCGVANAHTLYFSLTDDGDNIVELEGMFSNGATAMKIPVKLYDKENGKVLWEDRTDEFGICTFTRPDVPYEVEMDAGPGHQARQDGI